MHALAEFDRHRPLLFALAYRMLGSVHDAEDILQEAYLRWMHAAMTAVDSPKDYLCAVVTRLSIDQLRSARVRRQTYYGIWLPEPLVTDGREDPGEKAALRSELSVAFLLLLERLSPVERAVFLLRDVFDYDYADIANVVDKSPDNCRQIARRARQRIGDRQARYEAGAGQAEAMTRQFVTACVSGDLQGLTSLLANSVTLRADGGGKARSAINPIFGSDRVARFFLGIQRKPGPPVRFALATVNGRPGV
ncbi:MAG TPA: RNA polymerase sigma-70 factor, partial [Symbiobacteriaceae bacterium]|nr:RNA polymerase sigma-70 factor [Symbiobacteriaceae bacterium]